MAHDAWLALNAEASVQRVVFAWSSGGPFRCLVARTDRGVCLSSIGEEDARARLTHWCDEHEPRAEIVEDARALATELAQLDAYWRGERKSLDVVLDLRGSAFQLSVWRALLAIPYGSTRTYGDVARAIGSPDAVRAIGGANGRNPVPPFVPCHRVVASDGIGGFTGGVHKKRALLALKSQQIFFA